MKYADRYGNRWEETGLQDRFLEKLYKSVPGRAVVKVLVHPWVSRMGGWILSQKASCWLIPLFLKDIRWMSPAGSNKDLHLIMISL